MVDREWLVAHTRRCRFCALWCGVTLAGFSVRRCLDAEAVPAGAVLLVLAAWLAAVRLWLWGRRELAERDEAGRGEWR